MSAVIQPEGATELVPLARAGDQDAFTRLIERHESMVYGIIYTFLGNRERADEIAQDVFLQFYRSLSEIESDPHALFWLRQVTSRRCIDEFRRRRLHLISFDDAGEIPGAASPFPDPLRDRLLRRLVSELPEPQRIVVTLRFQEDLDPSDICGIVGMPVNTVKSHLQRALKSLRRKLGEAP
jgi:RNA polymerase sigma-70 factor, ECF subfamily